MCAGVIQTSNKKINTTLLVNNCTCNNNTAGLFGGGMGGVGYDGGSIFASIFGSGFSYNEAQGGGGGMYFQDNVSVDMSRIIFTDNMAATGNGGGTLLWVRN